MFLDMVEGWVDVMCTLPRNGLNEVNSVNY